jgi:ATP-binding cassette subfamily B protein RaxB
MAGVAFLAAVLYALLRLLIYSALRKHSSKAILRSAAQQTFLIESISAIRTIKYLHIAANRLARWSNIVVNQKNAELAAQRLQWMQRIGQTLTFGMSRICIMALGAFEIVSGRLTVGMLIAVLAYDDAFIRRMARLIDALFELRLLELQGARLGGIVLQKQEQNWRPREPLVQADQSGLVARDLRCRSQDNSRSVLDGVNFQVDAGEIVGLTGKPQCGSSTVLRCLLGLHPFTGQLTLGGISYRQAGWDRHRQQIIAVFEGDQLFAGTLADNIAGFSTQPDMCRVVRCAKIAGAHDFICDFAGQYRTAVWPGSSELSAQQRAQISIARALYREPKVLLIDQLLDIVEDEACSNLLQTLRSQRMGLLVISRKEAVLKQLDRVITLAKGKFEVRL